MMMMLVNKMMIMMIKSYLPSLNLSRVEAFTPRNEVSVPVVIIVMIILRLIIMIFMTMMLITMILMIIALIVTQIKLVTKSREIVQYQK